MTEKDLKIQELRRYINALYRHFLVFIEDNSSIDEESGIPHYKHMACNMAFICHMMEKSAKGGANDGKTGTR